MDFNVIFQGIIIALVSTAVIGIVGIYREMHKQNGRIGRIELWDISHEEKDELRYDVNYKALMIIQEDIKHLIWKSTSSSQDKPFKL